jgi:hypothetical protein
MEGSSQLRQSATKLQYNFRDLYSKFVANGKVCYEGFVAIATKVRRSCNTIFVICIASSSQYLYMSSQLRRQ